MKGQPTCRDHQDCPRGTYIASWSTSSSDRGCDFCEPGTYSKDTNAPSCTECETGKYQFGFSQLYCFELSVCPKGTFEEEPPTTSSDRLCTPCRVSAGEFQDGLNQPTCKSATICLPGQFISSDITPTTDRICGECDGMTSFSITLNSYSCTAVKPCPPGTEEISSPSKTQDRICEVSLTVLTSHNDNSAMW